MINILLNCFDVALGVSVSELLANDWFSESPIIIVYQRHWVCSHFWLDFCNRNTMFSGIHIYLYVNILFTAIVIIYIGIWGKKL